MADISIVVPVYNIEEFLPNCLNSIIKQTISNWELILIDDGSTDKSGKICDEFVSMDNRIHVIHKANSGVSESRNIGILKAKGQFISFVDGDDWLEPDFYEKLVTPMKSGADIVFCRFTREYPYKTIEHYEKNLTEFVSKPYDFSQIIYEYDMENTDRQTLSNTVFGSVCRSLFKKTVIDREKIYFPENIRIAEDRLFLMDYLLHCRKAVLVDYYGYHYRAEREGSAITSKTMGYQKELYQRRKSMLLLEFPIIERNSQLSKTERNDLITYEKYRLCFDAVINEIVFNSDYHRQLYNIFRDPFMRDALTVKSFNHMKRYGFTSRRIVLYMLIRIHFWDLIKWVLVGRRRNNCE